MVHGKEACSLHESQPGHSDGLLIDSRWTRDSLCRLLRGSNGNSTLAVAYRDTAVAYNVVSRDIAVAYNVVSRDVAVAYNQHQQSPPHEQAHPNRSSHNNSSITANSPANTSLHKRVEASEATETEPSQSDRGLSALCSLSAPLTAKDWGPRAWSVDKGWRMVCWARNRLKFGWQPRWPAEDRNWCWEAVKERCHQSLRAPETWDTYREEVTRMGKAPSAVDAPFSGLLEPEVCEVHKGPPARFTLPQARAAEKWFKKHVKVYVLNLPANTERWRMISSRLGALGLTFQRVWGVDMREPTMLETAKTEGWVLPTYNIKKAQEVAYSPQFHKGSILGTVGCAAAHFKVQHQAMADGSPLALVLE
ncbi:unnamed protein product, partial [Polarella glacialis]